MRDVILIAAVAWPILLVARLAPYFNTLSQTRTGQLWLALAMVVSAAIVFAEYRRRWSDVIRIARSRVLNVVDAVLLFSVGDRPGVAALISGIPIILVSAAIRVFVGEPFADILTTLVLELFLWRLYLRFKRARN